MITPIVGTIDLKPGFASKPFFGINPTVMDEKGVEVKGAGKGSLVLKQSWPG
jgi:acetyl-CoA synthetase